jgi:hypothetical protein
MCSPTIATGRKNGRQKNGENSVKNISKRVQNQAKIIGVNMGTVQETGKAEIV